MSADQKGFEAWALSHGGMSLKLAPKMETIIGRFPATYYVDETEIAWRAWANKPAAIAPPVAAGSVDDLSKRLQVQVDVLNHLVELAQKRAEKAEAEVRKLSLDLLAASGETDAALARVKALERALSNGTAKPSLLNSVSTLGNNEQS